MTINEQSDSEKYAIWEEGVEYARAVLREQMAVHERIFNTQRPVGNDIIQPCFDAINACSSPFNYAQYNAHITWAGFFFALDFLTVHPEILDENGVVYEADDDPNPYAPKPITESS